MKVTMQNIGMILFILLLLFIISTLYTKMYYTQNNFTRDIQDNCKVTYTALSNRQGASWNSEYGNNKVAPTISQCSEE